jgi:hypothetical protein
MKRRTDVRDDDAGPVIPGQARRTEVAPAERIAFGGRSHRLKEIGGPADAATPGAALVRGNTGRGQGPDHTTDCDDLAASANLRWIRSRPSPICPRRRRTRVALCSCFDLRLMWAGMRETGTSADGSSVALASEVSIRRFTSMMGIEMPPARMFAAFSTLRSMTSAASRRPCRRQSRPPLSMSMLPTPASARVPAWQAAGLLGTRPQMAGSPLAKLVPPHAAELGE